MAHGVALNILDLEGLVHCCSAVVCTKAVQCGYELQLQMKVESARAFAFDLQDQRITGHTQGVGVGVGAGGRVRESYTGRSESERIRCQSKCCKNEKTTGQGLL